ncbi:DUF4426 domain-containing protein [Alteromonas sp. ASW11-36]|uniref:DUF4426 domain-containing protein n=1 Tax=Alteromonas arenosi TaxID=3055817 RepID=A0ABT7STH7_9ALTE|nr:DUF4426 domain-containing protein [Alteromonas sp. ASW11-36]MDM7859496.1 DUF4426 domain-containing protein [Alteromonas sp. ASW11-36]
MRWRTLLAVFLSGLLITPSVFAEQKQTLGDWDVHYMVVSTTFLTPEVAKANGIVRSRFNALVNISVLDSDTKAALKPAVSGSARNLIGTTKQLQFKRVVEGDAVYYLAVLSYRDMENYTFNIDIQQGNTKRTLTFSQKLYVD